jgi:GTP-binding protein Era
MEPMHAGFVALVGKPNVGKSTLLNALLGTKVAPISPKPQTTRKRVRGIYTEGQYQIVFVDTPGLHRHSDPLGAFMDREMREALSGVDLLLWVVDLRHPPTSEDRLVAEALTPFEDQLPIFLVGNKLDLANHPEEHLEAYNRLLKVQRRYMLSAFDERAVAQLRADLLELIPEGTFLFPPDFARSDQSPEEWSAEIVREEAMKHLREEVPYGVATKTEEFSERENGMIYIRTILYVERPSHKPILIGREGRKLKEIGQAARKQLEVLLNRKVYLELEVKVYPDWRKDPEALRELGYA